jgi:hypothetical protein
MLDTTLVASFATLARELGERLGQRDAGETAIADNLDATASAAADMQTLTTSIAGLTAAIAAITTENAASASASAATTASASATAASATASAATAEASAAAAFAETSAAAAAEATAKRWAGYVRRAQRVHAEVHKFVGNLSDEELQRVQEKYDAADPYDQYGVNEAARISRVIGEDPFCAAFKKPAHLEHRFALVVDMMEEDAERLGAPDAPRITTRSAMALWFRMFVRSLYDTARLHFGAVEPSRALLAGRAMHQGDFLRTFPILEGCRYSFDETATSEAAPAPAPAPADGGGGGAARPSTPPCTPDAGRTCPGAPRKKQRVANPDAMGQD